MPFIPAPGTVRVEMFYALDNETIQNVYHVAAGTPASVATLTSIGNVFVTWENTIARDNRTTFCTFTGVRVTDLSSISAAQVFIPQSPPTAGTVTGDCLPAYASWAVKANTTRGARGYQGRTFWIGIAENMTSGNAMVTGNANAIVAALESLRGAVETSAVGRFMAVLHSKSGGVDLNPRLPTVITSWGARDRFLDTQRSRMPGKRRHKRS